MNVISNRAFRRQLINSNYSLKTTEMKKLILVPVREALKSAVISRRISTNCLFGYIPRTSVGPFLLYSQILCSSQRNQSLRK